MRRLKGKRNKSHKTNKEMERICLEEGAEGFMKENREELVLPTECEKVDHQNLMKVLKGI